MERPLVRSKENYRKGERQILILEIFGDSKVNKEITLVKRVDRKNWTLLPNLYKYTEMEMRFIHENFLSTTF